MSDSSPKFFQAIDYLVHNEGSEYVNNPIDSGGPTKFGITKKTYESWIGHAVLNEEIELMTLGTARMIYYQRYWTEVSCSKIDQLGSAICIFDSAVLYGVYNASRLAQRAANKCGFNLKIDGVLGDKSVAAINAIEQGPFLREFHALILRRIDMIIEAAPKNEAFRNGWTRRADRLLTLTEAGIVK